MGFRKWELGKCEGGVDGVLDGDAAAVGEKDLAGGEAIDGEPSGGDFTEAVAVEIWVGAGGAADPRADQIDQGEEGFTPGGGWGVGVDIDGEATGGLDDGLECPVDDAGRGLGIDGLLATKGEDEAPTVGGEGKKLDGMIRIRCYFDAPAEIGNAGGEAELDGAEKGGGGHGVKAETLKLRGAQGVEGGGGGDGEGAGFGEVEGEERGVSLGEGFEESGEL